MSATTPPSPDTTTDTTTATTPGPAAKPGGSGRGLLVVIEGIDGAGTTTQTRLLASHLAARGVPVHATREPSDGPVGRLLRDILSGAHAPVDQTTLSLLFAADRADHVRREVDPALARRQVVVSDRWYHSSLAYQGTGEERLWIAELNRRARRPDLTLFVSVAPEIAARRRADAGRPDELFDELATQRRVAEGYRAVIDMLGATERIEIIDGDTTIEQVAGDIARLVDELCRDAGVVIADDPALDGGAP